jgi:hypothetical protein
VTVRCGLVMDVENVTMKSNKRLEARDLDLRIKNTCLLFVEMHVPSYYLRPIKSVVFDFL